MAAENSLKVDTQTCYAASNTNNHSNYTEEEAELRKLSTLSKTNTLVTLTYTVESQLDEGVADLGTSHRDVVTTVIVDPDDSITYPKVETPPTVATDASEASGGSPQYICQSCSKLTPLENCYCAHCGHKRGRGRPRGVTGAKGLPNSRTSRTPSQKQETTEDSKVLSPPSSSPSSSSSSSTLPTVDLQGSQTSSRQTNHKSASTVHRPRSNLSKKSLLRSKLHSNGGSVAVKEDRHQSQDVPCGDQPCTEASTIRYLCPLTTPIVTLPVYPEGGELSSIHGNTDRPASLLHDDRLQSGTSDGHGEELAMGGAKHVAKAGSCNQSILSEHLPNPSEPSNSSQPYHQTSSLTNSSITTSTLLHSENSDLVMFHMDVSVPGSQPTPVAMGVNNTKDSHNIGGEYVILQGRQSGEETSAGPTSFTSVLAPVFHMPADHYTVVPRSDIPLAEAPQTIGGSPVRYQMLHPQSFIQSTPPGVMRCSTSNGVPQTHLQAVWAQPTPSGRPECGRQAYRVVESLPHHHTPTSAPSKPGHASGRDAAPPPNGWGQMRWVVPLTHNSWPPLSSPSPMNAEAASMKAMPPAALSSGGAGSWTEHPSTGESHPPAVSYAHPSSGCVLSPTHRYPHVNGGDEHPIIVCEVGVSSNEDGRSQEECASSEEDRPVKLRRLNSEGAGIGGVAPKGCIWCSKMLEKGFYQCNNCKENYQLTVPARQPSPSACPVLLSSFVDRLQSLGMLEQVMSSIASEQLQARLGLKKAEDEYKDLEVEHEDVVHRKALKTKELSNLTNELHELIGNIGISPVT